MAFTDEEKEKICVYSGWPYQALKVGTIAYNSYLNDWIVNLSYSETMEDYVRTFLQRVNNIDTQLQEATTRLQASTVGHNEISLNSDEIWLLRKERRSIIREMKSALNIPEYVGYQS